MWWDDRLRALFDDLEQQAEGLALADRDAEVAELLRAEYAEIDLTARLHASIDTRLHVEVLGVGPVEGAVRRVGEGWILLAATAHDWIVATRGIGSVRGLADRVAPERARTASSRLTLGSALRGVVATRAEVVVHRNDGSMTNGLLGRVGADFVEVRVAVAGQVETVPFTAITAVRSC